MTVREQIEQEELARLSPGATPSARSKGRARAEEPCQYRTAFMRDRDRIVHSKAFRRLKHKTQVFISPEGDHYRTRLTHTLEVAQISRTIARSLRLCEDLTEAVALGHDLGHTPFGHAGEKALSESLGRPFRHNEQSLRVLSRLEKNGTGLNLSAEVLIGVLCHTGDKRADTREGQIVHYADRIAYINHDIDDAIRARILTEDSIPRDIRAVLGSGHSGRIDHLVGAMIAYGQETGEIGIGGESEQAMLALRAFMFEAVYKNPVAKGEESKGIAILQALYAHFLKHPDRLPGEYQTIAQKDGLVVAICDYIAGMTDRFAVDQYQAIFIPKSWSMR